MMWKIINKLPFALLLFFLFATCDKEEYNKEDIRGDSEKIHFEIVVAKATATSSGVETRVATSPTYESTFENGDEIGVYIVKGSGGLQSAGNWVDNMKMTYNNGSWVPVFPSGKEYYPTDGDKLNFYAYYPYNATVADALNMNISGLTDQSSAANLSKSDLLSASTLNVGKGSTPVQLAFSHALTMMELSVTGGGDGAEISSRVAVTLEGCKPDVLFNLSTRKADAAGNVTSVKMRRVEQSTDANYLTKYTYRALVPTQTVWTGAELFRFSHTQGDIIRALSHKLVSDVALYPEDVKPYNITLQGVSSGHTYNVGDYYPHKGFPILGVVFEVSNGGKNGKIVDLAYINRYAPVPGSPTAPIRWGDPTVDENAAGVAGIRDYTDGYAGTKNLINKRKDQSSFADIYCLFNWIYQTKNNGNVNGMWYLPAYGEYGLLVTLKDIIRPKIITAGGHSCIGMNYIRVLTERNTTEAGLMDSGGQYGKNNKSDAIWTVFAVAVGKF